MNKRHILENAKEGDCFKIVGSDIPAIASSEVIHSPIGLAIRTNRGLVAEKDIESLIGKAWLCECNIGTDNSSMFWFVGNDNLNEANTMAEQILAAENKLPAGNITVYAYDGFMYHEYKSSEIIKNKTAPSEFFYEVPNKGTFHISIDDYGGDYPGVDVEWVGKDKEADIVGNPRVLFEFPADAVGPEVKVWEDEMNEDYTYKHTYDLSESERDDR